MLRVKRNSQSYAASTYCLAKIILPYLRKFLKNYAGRPGRKAVQAGPSAGPELADSNYLMELGQI